MKPKESAGGGLRMLRKDEVPNMSGFFFYPADTEGLKVLTLEERYELLTNRGNYLCGSYSIKNMSEFELGDVLCNLDNGRIPTHCLPDAKIPQYGDVPFNFVDPN